MSKSKFSRRSFIGGTIGLAASAPLLFGNVKPEGCGEVIENETFKPRTRIPNPWMEGDKPVVAIVHGTDFTTMLEKAMELLGGFKPFGIHNKVMIKPNFLLPQPYPLVTDGPSIEAVVAQLQKEGFKDVTITELGADPSKPCPVFDYFKLREKAEAGGFKVYDLLPDKFKQVQDETWQLMKFVNVAESIYNAPLIINMPTIKNHSTCDLTCSMKNNMGPIDFDSRMYMHREHEQPIDPEPRKAKEKVCVAEIAHAINPEVTLIDARQVMTHHHNNYRIGRKVDAGQLIVSGDPVAADRVAANLLASKHDGFKVDMVESTFKRANELGLGVYSLDQAVIKEAKV